MSIGIDDYFQNYPKFRWIEISWFLVNDMLNAKYDKYKQPHWCPNDQEAVIKFQIHAITIVHVFNIFFLFISVACKIVCIPFLN